MGPLWCVHFCSAPLVCAVDALDMQWTEPAAQQSHLRDPSGWPVLDQLRKLHAGPLNLIWDNAPAPACPGRDCPSPPLWSSPKWSSSAVEPAGLYSPAGSPCRMSQVRALREIFPQAASPSVSGDQGALVPDDPQRARVFSWLRLRQPKATEVRRRCRTVALQFQGRFTPRQISQARLPESVAECTSPHTAGLVECRTKAGWPFSTHLPRSLPRSARKWRTASLCMAPISLRSRSECCRPPRLSNASSANSGGSRKPAC